MKKMTYVYGRERIGHDRLFQDDKVAVEGQHPVRIAIVCGADDDTSVPAELERKMDEAIGHYPAEQKRSAAMPLLHLWQEQFGFISDEGVSWIAAKLGLQPINILELVTFYPMFRQAPAGRKHIRVCRTLSCAMAGSLPGDGKACAAAGEYRSRTTTTTACTIRFRSARMANTASNSSNASPAAAPRRFAWWRTNSRTRIVKPRPFPRLAFTNHDKSACIAADHRTLPRPTPSSAV